MPCTHFSDNAARKRVRTDAQDCPMQFDDTSCGLFVCCFADCLSGRASLLRFARGCL